MTKEEFEKLPKLELRDCVLGTEYVAYTGGSGFEIFKISKGVTTPENIKEWVKNGMQDRRLLHSAAGIVAGVQVGDILTRENAREGMVFRHVKSTREWVVQADCRTARGINGSVPLGISWHVPATILSFPGESTQISASIMGWVDAPPDPPVKTPSGRCDHGYTKCIRCDYARRYYASEVNALAKTASDKKGVVK